MLQRRWRSDLALRDIALKIELGELEELSIEVASDDGLAASSRMFAESCFPKTYRNSQSMPLAEGGSFYES